MTIQFGLPYFSPVSPFPIPMLESNNSILLNNIASWQDPTLYSDISLTVRKSNAEIVNNMMWLDYLQSGGLLM